MTLQELSDSWNELRNAAQGRGVAPIAPPAIAERVSVQWEAFRAWLGSLGPFDALAERVVTSVEGRRWIALHNELRRLLLGAGVQAVPDEIDEYANLGILGDIKNQAQSILVVVLLGSAAFFLLRGRK